MWLPNVTLDAGHCEVTSFAAAPHLADIGHEILINGAPVAYEPLENVGEALNVALRLEINQHRHASSRRIVLDRGDGSAREVRITLRFDSGNTFNSEFFVGDFSGVLRPGSRERVRNVRQDDELMFDVTGYSQARHLKDFYATFATGGGPPRTPRRVLDWGVGCGRCSRFLEKEWGVEVVYGADIDPVNVGWLRDSVSRPDHYVLHSPDPPLPFDQATFDFIYAISVFTHLAEERQRSWLAELRRIVRPGGIVVATTHGLSTFFAAVNDGAALREFLRRGFFVHGVNTDLDSDFEEAKNLQPYVNVFHTLKYIYEVWSEYFEVVRLYPAGILMQDYIVLRRR